MTSDAYCGARSPENLICTEPPRHKGPHEARGEPSGPVYETWPSELQLEADRDEWRSRALALEAALRELVEKAEAWFYDATVCWSEETAAEERHVLDAARSALPQESP